MLRIVVCVKAVMKPGAIVNVEPGMTIGGPGMTSVVNELDLFAVEEAIRLKEAAGGGEVVLLTVGTKAVEGVLRKCLAMGADRAIVLEQNDQIADPISIAGILSREIAAIAADLVLSGAQSSDIGHGSVGCAIAGFLKRPCVSFSKGIARKGDGMVEITSEIGGGKLQQVVAKLPLVVTVQTSSGPARHPNIKAVRLAKDKPVAFRPIDTPSPRGHEAIAARPSVKARQATMLEGSTNEIAKAILEIVRSRRP